MNDLTIIYLTASEVPTSFATYVRDTLLLAVGDTPIISISREPLAFGTNLLDDGEQSYSNIYRQLLRAAKLATTEFIAMAEDDTLYHESHFRLRPKNDEFLYNQNRFALFTWGPAIYSWRNRKSNCSLIAPRELLIESLEERFAKWPEGTPAHLSGELGRKMVEDGLGVTRRKSVEVFGPVSVIQFNHDDAHEERQQRHRKAHGPIKAYDLFHWRHAADLVVNYK